MALEQLTNNVKCNHSTDVWATASTVVEIFMMCDLWAIPDDVDGTAFVRSIAKKNDPPHVHGGESEVHRVDGKSWTYVVHPAKSAP